MCGGKREIAEEVKPKESIRASGWMGGKSPQLRIVVKRKEERGRRQSFTEGGSSGSAGRLSQKRQEIDMTLDKAHPVCLSHV